MLASRPATPPTAAPRVHGIMVDWAIGHMYTAKTPETRLHLIRTLRRLVHAVPQPQHIQALVVLMKSGRLHDSDMQGIMAIVMDLGSWGHTVDFLENLLRHNRKRVRSRACRFYWKVYRDEMINQLLLHRHGVVYRAILDTVKPRLRELLEIVLDTFTSPYMLERLVNTFMAGELEEALYVFLACMETRPDAWAPLKHERFFRLLTTCNPNAWKFTLEILSHVPNYADLEPTPSVYSRIAPHNCSFAKVLNEPGAEAARTFFVTYFRLLVQKIRRAHDDLVSVSMVLVRMLGCIAFFQDQVQIDLVEDILQCIEASHSNLIWERGWAILTRLHPDVWNLAHLTAAAVTTYCNRALVMWTNYSELDIVTPLFRKMNMATLKEHVQHTDKTDPYRLVTLWIGLPHQVVDTPPELVIQTLRDHVERHEIIAPLNLDYVLWGCMETLQGSTEGALEAIRICQDNLDTLRECRRGLSSAIRLVVLHSTTSFVTFLSTIVQKQDVASQVRYDALSAIVRCIPHHDVAEQSLQTCLDSLNYTLRSRTIVELASVHVDLFDKFRSRIATIIDSKDTVAIEILSEWSKYSGRLDDFQHNIVRLIEPYFQDDKDPHQDFPSIFLRLLRNLSPEPLRDVLRGFFTPPKTSTFRDLDWIKRLLLLKEFRVTTLQDLVPTILKLLHHPSVRVREEALLTLAHTQTLLVLRPALVEEYYRPLFRDLVSPTVPDADPRNREAMNAILLLKTTGSSAERLPKGLLGCFLDVWKHWKTETLVIPLLSLCPASEQVEYMDLILDAMEELSIDQLRLTECITYLRHHAMYIMQRHKGSVTYNRIAEFLAESPVLLGI